MIKTHKNVKIYSVINGTIIIEDEHKRLYQYDNASIKSIYGDIIVIEYSEPFTKGHLKTGMIVQFRNGLKRIFIQTSKYDIFTQNDNVLSLDYFTEDLLCKGVEDYDVMKIWEYPEYTAAINQAIKMPGKLIWER